MDVGEQQTMAQYHACWASKYPILTHTLHSSHLLVEYISL